MSLRGWPTTSSRIFPLAIEDYTLALKLEPTNPHILVRRGPVVSIGGAAPVPPLATSRWSLQHGFDLRLLSAVSDVSRLPTAGMDLVIVAAVGDVLHFRIFEGDGKVVLDRDERSLTTQAGPIANLKQQLKNLVASSRAYGGGRSRMPPR